MRLLIVDDSNIIRSRIARIVSDPRLPDITIVGMAKNGVEAITLLQQHNPEMVTMDLTMPEMDGVECTEAMIKMNPKLNILIVSALSDKATAIKALKKGAKGFLYKPFTDEQLVEAFVELLK
ncbi:MAG: response regulator [Burkholderiales bacterium]|jgi:two-component system chemotaxis response regulator CheY|nr:response regulator [Burkholderiales bacterium]